jgi:hypothetical protein
MFETWGRNSAGPCKPPDLYAPPTDRQSRGAFLHMLPPLTTTAVIPPGAVFNRGQRQSMTSEVMGGQCSSHMVPSLMQLTTSRLSGCR